MLMAGIKLFEATGALYVFSYVFIYIRKNIQGTFFVGIVNEYNLFVFERGGLMGRGANQNIILYGSVRGYKDLGKQQTFGF